MEKSDQLSRISNQNHFIDSFAYPQWAAAVECFPAWAPRLVQLKSNMEYFNKLKQVLSDTPKPEELPKEKSGPGQARGTL